MHEVQLRANLVASSFAKRSVWTDSSEKSIGTSTWRSLVAFISRETLSASPPGCQCLHGMNDRPGRQGNNQSEKDRFAREVVPRLDVILTTEMQKRSRPVAEGHGAIRQARTRVQLSPQILAAISGSPQVRVHGRGFWRTILVVGGPVAASPAPSSGDWRIAISNHVFMGICLFHNRVLIAFGFEAISSGPSPPPRSLNV